MSRVSGLVLLGPPGSGKSHLGRLLAARGCARYVEFEPVLMEMFGTGAAFAANKDAALDYLKTRYVELLGGPGPPLIIESTGLSERPIHLELAQTWPLAFAALRTPRAVCVSRIIARPGGSNLSNDPEAAGRFHDFCREAVLPNYRLDLTLGGLDERADAEAVERLLAAPYPRGCRSIG